MGIEVDLTSSPSKHIDLSLNCSDVYEFGARLLVDLAFPDDDNPEFAEIYASLCARALMTDYCNAPDDWAPITAKLQYLFRSPDIIDRDVAKVAHRLGGRIVAGYMAWPFIQQASGVQPKLRPGVKRLSLNQMAEAFLQEAGQSNAQNVKTRIWRPSRNVIHLCMAVAVFGQKRDINGLQSLIDTLSLFRSVYQRGRRRS